MGHNEKDIGITVEARETGACGAFAREQLLESREALIALVRKVGDFVVLSLDRETLERMLQETMREEVEGMLALVERSITDLECMRDDLREIRDTKEAARPAELKRLEDARRIRGLQDESGVLFEGGELRWPKEEETSPSTEWVRHIR